LSPGVKPEWHERSLCKRWKKVTMSHKITCMISDEVRHNIEALTKDGESFNDTVRRLLERASRPKIKK